MTLARTVAELIPLRHRTRRLLAVLPHPDDESYGCAGTLARAGADPDAATVYYCMTRGEASSMGPQRGLSPAEVAALREERLREVAALLALDGLVVGDFPDSGMARCRLDALGDAIGAVLDAFAPQVVISHDPRGVNAHPDHIATHWGVRHALLTRPGIRLAMLAYPQELVDEIRPRLMFATPEEEIDAVVRLTEREIEAKEACLRVHEAIVTLRADGEEQLLRRPPLERYDFFGEDFSPPLSEIW